MEDSTMLMTALLLLQAPAPLSADETRAFMRRLADYVFEHHLKKSETSEQRGMIYEYVDTTKRGLGRWVQGEALDTMHDGAWFAAALASAARATGDPFYEDFLARWTLPFYLKMLNHSDTLFSPDRDDSDPKGHRFGLEHRLQKGEKGFVPYWWDDGASVSLEASRKKTGLAAFSCTDRLAGRPNPEMKLDGWSHGSSNHKAQDLAVLLQTAWLLLREKHPKLAAETAEAARNLQDCRARHGAGAIPVVLGAAGLANRDAALLRRIGEARGEPSNHYTRCLLPRDPSKPEGVPGFADDQEYAYYAGLARAGGELPKPLAFSIVYDAYTNPMLLRIWSDTKEVPPGMGRFDLAGLSFKGGKPDPYRSDREIPMGSRVGPQTMVVCGWALQALEATPGLWDERPRTKFPSDVRVTCDGALGEPVSLGGAALRLAARRDALLVEASFPGDAVTVRLHAQPDGKGAWADLTIRKDRSCGAVNDRGEPLIATSEGSLVALPWTHAKGQKAWANGVEQFRYAVAVGAELRAFTLASTEAQVKAALRKELGEGLRTWKDVMDRKGYIPTGLGRWDEWSDAGGCAHLLKAGAQWLLVLDGKRDWEVQKFPRSE
jgi:hypothetical protein